MAMREISSYEELRSFYKAPSEVVVNKVMSGLDKQSANFIRHSTIAFIASVCADGNVEVSPRGLIGEDIQIFENGDICFVDRPGNNRLDTFQNVMRVSKKIGVLFVVPGIPETLRIKADARIFRDDEQKTTLLVATPEFAFFQCGKAIIRSGIFKPETYKTRHEIPPLAKIVTEQTKGKYIDAALLADILEDDYTNGL